MIKVTRLNGKVFYINNDLIEFIEETPDTVITTTTGKKIVVSDDIDVIMERILRNKSKVEIYKRKQLEDIE